MTDEIILRPDSNRPKLESRIAAEMSEGRIPDSIDSLGYSPWETGGTPRVMLIVPYFTRVEKPFEITLDNIRREHRPNIKTYESIVRTLALEGITHHKEMKRAGEPIGLLRVGTAAGKQGYEVIIVDGVYEGWNDGRKYFDASDGSEMFLYGMPKEAIAERIREFRPHVVGVTCPYTHQWGNAREIIDLVKAINEGIPVVIGGVHASGLPQDVLRDSPADIAVLRQADIAFPDLLNVLTGRTIYPDGLYGMEGIAFRKNGKVEMTRPRGFLKDISEIARPDYSLIDLKNYSGPFNSAGRRALDEGLVAVIFSSTGCDVGCTFCAIPGSQGGYRPVPPAVFGELLENLCKKGVSEVIEEADHMLEDPLHALKIFEQYKRHNLKWTQEGGLSLFALISLLPEVSEASICENPDKPPKHLEQIIYAKRSGVTTEYLIRKMAESGCYSAYLAVESANSASLERSHKPKLNAQQQYAIKIVNLLSRYGIRATCGLMLGFENETIDGIDRTIEYGKALKPAGASFVNPFIVTPLPGTKDWMGGISAQELLQYLVRNTDTGITHEFGSVNNPNGHWIRDEVELKREQCLYEANGIEAYRQVHRTGTWPVDR